MGVAELDSALAHIALCHAGTMLVFKSMANGSLFVISAVKQEVADHRNSGISASCKKELIASISILMILVH